jgi:RNA polymerase sigma factor (sigma-70 family)
MEGILNSPISDVGRSFVRANFAKYESELRGYIAKRAPADAVDDLAQQVWERLCRVKNPERIKEPLAYIHRVAGNVIADHFGKHAKTSATTAHTCFEGCIETPASQSSSSLLDGLLAQAAFEWILRHLRPRHREILVFRNLCDFSYATIGTILKFTPDTTEQYYYDAMIEAQSLLEKFERGVRRGPESSSVDGPTSEGAEK